MRIQQLLPVGLALLLAPALACGSKERVTILSEGSGPANVEPLQPPWTASLSSAEASFRLARSHRFRELVDDESVIAIDEGDAFSGMATALGWDRNDTVFTAYRDDGMWVLRQTPDSFEDGAVLHVPGEVRVGMKWRNGSEEGGLTYEVVGRVEEVPTTFGLRTMWGIRSSAAGFDDVVRYYFEGLGVREVASEWREDKTPRTWIGASLGQAVEAPPSPARTALSSLTIFPTTSEDPTVHRREAWMPRGVIVEPNGTATVQFDTWEFLAAPARQAWCIAVDGGSAAVVSSNFCNAPEARLAPPHRWVFDDAGQAHGALADPAGDGAPLDGLALANVEAPRPAPTATIADALERWRDAWDAGDVETYLDSYAPQRSPRAGLDRGAWERQRRARVTPQRDISVSIDDLRIEVDGARAVTRFEQTYRARSYADRTSKRLSWERQDGRWRIVEEAAR